MNLSGNAKCAALNRITAMLDGGTLEIYGRDQDLLVVLDLSDPAFSRAVDSSADANPIASGVAIRSGLASVGKWKGRDGTPVMDCSVSESGTDIELSTASISVGSVVSVTDYKITLGS